MTQKIESLIKGVSLIKKTKSSNAPERVSKLSHFIFEETEKLGKLI